MAKDGHKIFDSDIHVSDPPDLWARYMDAPFRHRAPRGSEFAFRNALPFLDVDGRMMPFLLDGPGRPVLAEPAIRDALRTRLESRPDVKTLQAFQQSRFAEVAKLGWPAKSVLEAMDTEGVDLTVLYPTSGLFAMALDDVEPAYLTAVARAYNNWLYDYCQADPQRLMGAAMLAPHSVEDAVRETHRAAKELGFRAVFLRPNPVLGRNWYDPAYEPLWAAAEELDLAVAFHEGVGSYLPQAGDRFGSNMFLRHVACHPMEMMYAAMAMCGGGVLERHPRLRVALLEGNCGWVPWLLDRMDDHYEVGLGISTTELPQAPSVYFKRQCFVSVEAEEHFVRPVVDYMGDRNFVFSTDWPHPDSKFPTATQHFLDQELPAVSKRRILWDNCAALYGIK